MRQRYRKNPQTGEYEWVEVVKQPARPSVAPSIRTDTIPREYNHGTGRWHDSRSDRAMHMKAAGIEAVGSDYEAPKRQDTDNLKDIETDMKETINELRWGQSDVLTEEDKQECKALDDRIGWKPGK